DVPRSDIVNVADDPKCFDRLTHLAMKCCTLFRSSPPVRGGNTVRLAYFRENAIFSTENAPSDEKTPSSRRRTRPPTRKRHLLDGACVLRRENAIFSTTVRQGEKMNPSGVQFGRSRGLLQIRGEEVLLSEKLLEQARHSVDASAVAYGPPWRLRRCSR